MPDLSVAPKSLALLEFEQRRAVELRTFWSTLAAFEYAERWWKSIDETTWPDALHNNAGDDVEPFTHLEGSAREFLNSKDNTAFAVRESAVVALITNFEAYMFDALQRALIVSPVLLEKFNYKFQASDFAGPIGDRTVREWLARQVADREMRGKTHDESYRRLARCFQCDLPNDKETTLAIWTRWTHLRNAVVHACRVVTPELKSKWPERYKREGDFLALTNVDITTVAQLSLELAQHLDKRYASEIIRDADARVLVGQLTTRFKITDPVELANRVRKTLNIQVSGTTVASWLQE